MNKHSQNSDQNEIAKFASLADKWWDLHGEFKPLHDINPLRLKFILDQVNISGKNVIDMGCGGGILSESMAAKNAIVTGVDLAEESITVAIEHAKKNNLPINYLCEDIEKIAQTHAEKFDILTCMELLEHVPDPEKMVKTCSALVKPGGHLFFSTINRNWKSYLKAIVGAEYLLRMLPIGTHDYTKLIKPSELEFWCREAGIQWKEILGLNYNPLTDTFSTTTNVEVNYMVYGIKS